MAKRDYYEVLGREPRCLRGGHQEGLPQARDEAPSGPQSGRQGRRGEIQGSEGGLRDPLRRRRSARPTISSATPASIRRRDRRRGRARRADGFGGFADAFGDIFSDIFGAQRGGAGAATASIAAPTCATTSRSALEEAARGTETKIRIPTMEECETCHGTGAKPGTQPKTCETCHGRGEVRVSQGFFSIQQTCPTCHGARQGRSGSVRDLPWRRAGSRSTRRCR